MLRSVFCFGDAQLPQGGPVARERGVEEEADAVEGDLEGGGREVLLVLEEEEVLAQLGLGDLVGRPAEVGGELADRAQIRLLGTLAQAGELQLLAHALAQRRGAGRVHDGLLSQRGSGGGSTLRKGLLSARTCCRAAAYLNNALQRTHSRVTPRAKHGSRHAARR